MASSIKNNAPVAHNDILAATEDTAIIYNAIDLLGNDTDIDGNLLTIASITTIRGGTAVLNVALQTVTFTPTPNFNGAAYFTYLASDGTSNSNVAVVTVNVAAVNDAPVALGDSLFAIEDTPITFSASALLWNDTDVDNNTLLTIASVTSGKGGIAVLNGDGTVTFTPNANFNGTADFTYQATDGSLRSNSATATIDVFAVNDAPVAVSDLTLTATREDTQIIYQAIDLLGNDTDVDSNTTLTISSVASGTGGTVVLNSNGTVTFTPDPNFNGVASFSYQASDGTSDSNSATASLRVTAVNDAPVAVNDNLNAVEDTPITYTAQDLLGNDTDVDSASFIIVSVVSGTGGVARLNAGGTVTFTPAPDFNGSADFTYQISDGSLLSNFATAIITVKAVNDAPIARPDGLIAQEDTPITYQASALLFNDTDVDGTTTLTIASVTSGNGGTAVLNSNGSVTFTPTLNFNGPADFTYQATDGLLLSNVARVNVFVNAINDAPVAVGDRLSALEETPIVYTAQALLGNDTDVDGNSFTITSVTNSINGTAVLDIANQTVTFTPKPLFHGEASFSYQITDNGAPNLTSNTAIATITVGAVNHTPVATPDILIAVEDTEITYTALALLDNDTDADGNPLTIGSVSNPTGGTVVLNTDGTVTFTPTPNFNGPATFSYTANDGTSNSVPAIVTVNVFAVNDAPVAVADSVTVVEDTAINYSVASLLANDTDVDSAHNTLTIASVTSGANGTAVLDAINQQVIFTPNANFNGIADFTYQISDGSLTSNSATVSVTVTAVNDAPVAVPDTLTATNEDTARTYSFAELLVNDTDVDSPHSALTVASVVAGTGGTVSIDPVAKTVTFTPTPNFNGSADFTYFVSDGSATSALAAKATLTVNPVNDAPVAAAGILSLAATHEDTSITYQASDLLVNVTDVDSTNLSITHVVSGAGGQAVLNGDGTVTFTPTPNFNGVAGFTYQATDGLLNSNTATANIVVIPVNDAPVAVGDIMPAILEDTVTTYTFAQLLANDTDVDNSNSQLTITAVTAGTGGTVTLGAGIVTFTPTPNYNGPASFSYVANDGTADSVNSATVSFTVTAVNDAPIAVADILTSTNEDTPITYTATQLLGNDTDVEHSPLIIVDVINDPINGNGIASLNTDGSVTFRPNANFNGAATFSYRISDGALVSAPAIATVTVNPVNDAPVVLSDTALGTVQEDTQITYTALQLLTNVTDIDSTTLTIASVTSGAGGNAVLNGDGSVTFTPTLNFNGPADFTYQVTDGQLNSNTGKALLAVLAVNDAPIAVGDNLNAVQDTSITYAASALLGNDTDVDSTGFTINSVTNGTGGTVALNLDGTVTFTPTPLFNGTANFTYTITDNNSVTPLTSAAATVNVTVGALNYPPIATPDTLIGREDTAITYLASDLLANDTDIEHNPLTIGSVSNPTGGTVVLNTDGTVTFTPTPNFNGPATFSYTANDGTSNSVPAIVTVNVFAVNDAPVAVADSVTVVEDTAINYSVASLLANDTDVDSAHNTLTIASVTSGANGTAVLDAINQQVIFTPNANFNGIADFTYQISDGSLTSNSATVSVTVTAVNDAPVAVPDTLTATNEDTARTYSFAELLVNDTDVDSPHSALTVASVAAGTGGTVSIDPVAKTVTFTPTPNFNGSADFTYFVSDGSATSALAAKATLTVNPVNDAPVAAAGILSLAATHEDTSITYQASDLLVNVTDVDSTNLSITHVVSGAGGQAVLNGDGTVTFTPTPNFNGVAGFTYQATDGLLNSNTATANIVVIPVNDAPVAVGDIMPAILEDTVTTYTFAQLLANDTDVDNSNSQLTITAVTAGTGGTVTLGAGIVTFTPTPNYNGPASFSYVANDGTADSVNSATVSFTVTAVNDAPIAVADILTSTNEDTPITYTATQLLGNDTDVEHSPLIIVDVINDPINGNGIASLNTDGSVTFRPNANFNGAATFSYRISDGALVSAPAIATVTVNPVNDAPVVLSDTALGTVQEDTQITYTALQLLTNVTDIDSTTLTIASVTSGAGGNAVLNGDGSVTFTPTLNFNGPADFTYQVTDGQLNSNTGKALLAVLAVNDAPIAVGDNLNAVQDTSITYAASALLGNDTDVDSTGFTINSVTNGTGGTVALNLDGTVTFTPTPLFNGTANFTYTITDNNSVTPLTSAAATVNVTVGALNYPPIATPDTLIGREDTAITYLASDLLANDTDIEHNPLTIGSVSNPTGGTVVLNTDGTVTFTPTPNFNGPATFSYTANDGTSNSVPAIVTVNVFAVNDAPVAVADSVTVVEDTAINYSVASLLANDTDVDSAHNTLTIASVTSGANGTAVLDAINQQVIFTPNANFNGIADFTYQISDGSLTSNSATVSVTVTAVNDAPVAVPDTLTATNEDTARTYSFAELLVNDTDVDSPHSALTVASVAAGTGGTVSIDPVAKTVTFTPTPNFNGSADFTYFVSDGSATSALAAKATLTVNPVNDAPVAAAGILSLAATHEDTSITYQASDLLVNVTDVDSTNLSITHVVSGAGGQAVLNGDGTVTFTPTPNFNGVAGFTYQATDGLLNSNTATANIVVIPVNDAPVAVGDIMPAILEDTVTTYTFAQLLANDTDVDNSNSQLTITAVTAGTGGTVTLGAGIVTFTPTPNYNGPASFSYVANDGTADSVNSATVSFTVTAVNDAPIAVADILTSTNEDTPITYTATQLLGNDTDIDSLHSVLTIASVANSTGGTAVLNVATQTIIFTPTLNYNGPASFTYQVSDGQLLSLPVTATLTVSPVNDAPVAGNIALSGTNEDTSITYAASALLASVTDIDSNNFTIASVTSGNGGNAVLNGDGSVTFTPTLNFNGSATFTFKASDGLLTSNAATASISVAAVNDAPVAVGDSLIATNEDTPITYTATQLLGNDTDIDNLNSQLTIASVTSVNGGVAVLNVASQTVTFTPTLDFNGQASFTYQASDGFLNSNSATATFTVNAVNDAPIAVGDTLIATEGASITYLASSLLGNDTDVEHSPLTISSVTSGVGGTAVLNAAAQTITFSPALNFSGAASFTYKANDGVLNSNSATVAVNVTPINHAPVFTTPTPINYIDTAFVDTFTTATGFLVATDIDVGNTLTYNITGGTDNLDGTVSISDANNYGVLTITKATGEYKFVPNSVNIEPLAANATTTFTVVVSDSLLSVSKPFTINITQSGSTETNGSDALLGSTGIDHWAGLKGDDLYYVDNSLDVVTEQVNEGTDIVYSTATSYTLGANVENLVVWGAGLNGTGNDLSNYIFGNDSNNIIDGGAGADIMYGGLGSDTYYVDNVGDVVSETGSDWDTIYSSVSYTLSNNVEALFLTGGASINATGNMADNYLIGNTANNVLNGGAGADVMAGGLGDDSYYVDNAADTVVENASEGFDTVYAGVNYTLAANVEALTLTGTATDGFGNDLNNTLTGNSGNNVLGGAGGVDTMIGGLGNDTYYVDSSAETVTENAGEGTDIVYSTAASYTLADNVENLVVWGAGVNGTGNALDNYIFGSTGDNTLDGGLGNDILYGDLGSDTLIGGLGADIYNLTESTPFTDTVHIATGDSLATIGGYDMVTSFQLGTNVFSTAGVDKLDLDSTAIGINTASVNGIDVGNIHSHSISNGIISFDDIDNYTAPLTITAGDLSNVFGYLQSEITGGLTVAFISSGNTYVFQDGGSVDTVVELVGVTASSINTLGQGTNALWLV